MTGYAPNVHHRRSIRLPRYDYAQAGVYFVTVCARNRDCVLGRIVAGRVKLTRYGEIARACWEENIRHFAHVRLDEFVVMPNHIHGVIALVEDNVGARHAVPLHERQAGAAFGKPIASSLPTLVRSFKSASTKRVNQLRRTPGAPLWQRNYYERVVRNEEELNRIREHIVNNPLEWALDRENPNRTGVYSLEEEVFNPVRRARPWHTFSLHDRLHPLL